MRKDLEICVADFKELMDKLDWAISNKALTPLLLFTYGVAIRDVADQVQEIAVGALRDQEEEGGESHEDLTNASAH